MFVDERVHDHERAQEREREHGRVNHFLCGGSDPGIRSTAVRLSSVSAKVFLAFLVILATFGGVSTWGAVTMLRLGDGVQRIASSYLPLRIDLHDLQARQLTLVDLIDRMGEEAERAAYIKHVIDMGRVSRRRNVHKIKDTVDTLALDARSDEERKFLATLATRLRGIDGSFQESEELFDQVFGPMGNHPLPPLPLDPHVQQKAREQLQQREMALLEYLREMLQQLSGEVERAKQVLSRDERRAVAASALLALLAAAVGLGMMALVGRALRPLRRLAESAKELGRGNYRQRVPAAGTDEVAQLAAEFNAMASALEERELRLIRSERLAAVGRIAAHITHEVRNPLSSIGLNAELLEEELDGSPEAKKLAQAIVREVDRLAEITEEYLRFARLPRPRLESEDLNVVVGSLLSFLRGELAGRGIAVEADLARDLPPVSADENQLRQALLNILRNGAEAMGGGGSLRVETRAADDGRVAVCISDTGCGIAAEHQAKIFDPFFTTKEKGTGLGLALTQQIIVEHGGSIELSSEPGRGTTFTVRLPRAEREGDGPRLLGFVPVEPPLPAEGETEKPRTVPF